MDMFKVKLSQLTQHGDLLDRYGASVRILGQKELLKPDVLEAINRAAEMTKGNGSAVLNVCFPYTSRDEMTTAVRRTVEEYSKPLPAQNRQFSQTRITQKLRSRHLSSDAANAAVDQAQSSGHSDNEDSISSSTTLHNDQSNLSDGSADTQLASTTSESLYPDPETITPSTLESNLFTAGDPPLDLLIRTSGVKRLSDFMLWQCHDDTKLVFLDCMWPEFSLRHFLPVLIEWQWQRKYGEDRERGEFRKAPTKTVKVQ
jgi:ditrans,polycis-polyprenyl diphosphate synthase